MTEANEIEISKHDAVVIVTMNQADSSVLMMMQGIVPYREPCRSLIRDQVEYDAKFKTEGGLIIVPNSEFKRLVISPVGPANRDFDDARTFMDAATNGITRALKAGARNPLLVLPRHVPTRYDLYDLAIMLGVHQILYVPLENREWKNVLKVDSIEFTNFIDSQRKERMIHFANAIESGRAVARDIGGSDPERMSAPKTAEYIQNLFGGRADSAIKVEIISDPEVIKKEFPCLAAVDRASVERHRARVILLSYEPEGTTPERSLFLVGKGVTYDTGGADVKSGGVMAGMHRDKCGAAAVAGFFETIDRVRPKNIRAYGAMSMVRNSIGPNGYVADELIVSRAGVKLRVGNTDAEGRMAMVDLVAYFKEKIVREKIPNAEMFTIATLTGHCCMAVGFNYSIIMDNGPARNRRTAQNIQEAGERVGDLFEVSTIRREDFKFNEGKSEYEDILQSNNAPSSRTPRGHQIPAAFLIQVSKMDQHGIDSEYPIPFSHIDIAGSSGPFPGVPTGAPIAALATRYLLEESV